MEDDFPAFTESGFYKEWLKGLLAFPDQTEEQKRHCLELAYYIWQEAKKEHEVDREDPALPE